MSGLPQKINAKNNILVVASNRELPITSDTMKQKQATHCNTTRSGIVEVWESGYLAVVVGSWDVVEGSVAEGVRNNQTKLSVL